MLYADERRAFIDAVSHNEICSVLIRKIMMAYTWHGMAGSANSMMLAFSL
jgi:hypothetical protein